MPYVVGYGQKLDQNLGIQWNAWQAAPFPCAVLPGGCCGMSRKVFFDIQGFDHDFRGWGYEDVDISLKLWLFGYKCYVQPSVKVLHLFRETYPYAVTWENTYYNMLRMAYSHFNKERIQKCKQLIKNVDADYIESLVLQSDVLKQRQSYLARRTYDDNWFMQTFGIPF
jgi:GT2 family glycosyltransferase